MRYFGSAPDGEISVTLEVIGAGFGRTGTHSLKRAIEVLGFGPCHHMYEVRRSPEQLDMWTEVSRGAHPDWGKIFSGFRSQVDWPASCFWEELADHFPTAKVVLTVRDPDAWYHSISRTILPSSELGRTMDETAEGRAGSDIIYRLVLEQIFGGRLADKDHAVHVYNDHIDRVTATIPPERLLVYNVKDGWGPLTDFLGVPVPDVEFPSGNSVADFRSRKPYLSKT